jgi:hypothetical protein
MMLLLNIKEITSITYLILNLRCRRDKPLNGEDNPLSDGKFQETPAKWTGNGSRMAKPDKNDWYETVKELWDSS